MIEDDNDFCSSINQGMYTLEVEPYIKPELKVKILNQWINANIHSFPMVTHVLKDNFTLIEVQGNDYDIIIDGVFGNKPIENNNAYKIFFSGEPISAKLEGYDLSLGFDYFNDDMYIRYPLYYIYYFNKINAEYKREGTCNPDKQYFSCFLVRNARNGDGAIARTEFFHELSQYKNVTSGGGHLNNIGKIIPSNETFNFLSKCKFTIAYENNFQLPGYMTEKVFQAYFAGSMPIYSSHPEAQNEINKNAIISRQDFESNQDMINYIIKLDNDNDEYCKIWNNQIIIDPDRNYQKQLDKIRKKLDKDFIKPFLKRNYNCCLIPPLISIYY